MTNNQLSSLFDFDTDLTEAEKLSVKLKAKLGMLAYMFANEVMAMIDSGEMTPEQWQTISNNEELSALLLKKVKQDVRQTYQPMA